MTECATALDQSLDHPGYNDFLVASKAAVESASKLLLSGPGRVGPGRGVGTGCERGSWHGI